MGQGGSREGNQVDAAASLFCDTLVQMCKKMVGGKFCGGESVCFCWQNV
jgi:hypothetical protein